MNVNNTTEFGNLWVNAQIMPEDKSGIDAADIMNMCLCHRLNISADYGMYGKIAYVLPNYDTIMVNSDFGSNVKLEILVLNEKANALKKEITEITNGSAVITDCGELYEDFSSVIK